MFISAFFAVIDQLWEASFERFIASKHGEGENEASFKLPPCLGENRMVENSFLSFRL